MSEAAEDVKPKIDLTINHEGQSQHLLCLCSVVYSELSTLTLGHDLSHSVHGQSEIHHTIEEGFRGGRGTRS